MNTWYQTSEAGSGAAISSRVRLARNLKGYPFPERLDGRDRARVIVAVRGALENAVTPELSYYDMTELTGDTAVALAERHLISPEFALDDRPRGLLISDDESVSVMLCEEDHVRIQAFGAGLSLSNAYAAAAAIDDVLGSTLRCAFDDRLGYLSQNPANLGTGMRASVMMHLPALSKSGQSARLANTLDRLGLSMTGVYGDGSAAKGDVFRIANRVTMGITEEAAIANLNSFAMQIATKERDAAERLAENISIQDRIHRAYGILETARLLSADEMLDLFSWVRIGVDGGIINANTAVINELTITLQAANLSLENGGITDVDRRDAIRAKTVKEKLFC